MEQVISNKIIIEIETNKATYREEFETIVEARKYWNDFFNSY